LLGLITASFLPETLHQNLPESVKDAEEFGKAHRYLSFLPKHNKGTLNNDMVRDKS